jgi:hypothetical protein
MWISLLFHSRPPSSRYRAKSDISKALGALERDEFRFDQSHAVIPMPEGHIRDPS